MLFIRSWAAPWIDSSEAIPVGHMRSAWNKMAGLSLVFVYHIWHICHTHIIRSEEMQLCADKREVIIIAAIVTFPVPILVRLKWSMCRSKGVHLHFLKSHSLSSSTDTLWQKIKMCATMIFHLNHGHLASGFIFSPASHWWTHCQGCGRWPSPP